MKIPKSYYVYEFSYPKEMSELAGIVFYVGKGTSLSRMDDHFREAAREDCSCEKCQVIRSIWAKNLIVVRNVVFTSKAEKAALQEEGRRIALHSSPHLTNIQQNRSIPPRVRTQEPQEPQAPAVAHDPIYERTHEAIKRLLALVVGMDKDQVIPDISLWEDPRIDFIHLVQITLLVEDYYGLDIPSEDMQRIRTVRDLEWYLKQRVDLGSSVYGHHRHIPEWGLIRDRKPNV